METRTIDVATTATLRPALYEQTLRSFEPMLRQHDRWRLLLNIDTIGDEGTVEDVMDVAARYFDDIACVRVARHPDFRRAWRWCVSELQSEYVFWLEDDWELVREVDFPGMLRIMDAHPDLATLRLPRWDANEDGTFRQWNKRAFDGWNGSFVQIRDENKYNCGYSNNPSLTRKDFLQPLLPYLKPDVCPEKQINGFNGVCYAWVQEWRFGVMQRPREPLVVRDIGEQWRKDRRLGKGDKMCFSTWEKNDGRKA